MDIESPAGLITGIEKLAFLPGAAAEKELGGRLALLKKLLRLKLNYEISTGDGGPVIAIVVGGTNVGKSTVFNVLVGTKIARPSEKAGTTKFPVVSLPDNGDADVLSSDFLPAYEKRELTGDLPETRLDAPGGVQHFFYTSRRGRDFPGLAIFDAPDIDSVTSRLVAGDKANFLLAEDLMIASDLVLFVTTPEKYNVERCMDFLVLALSLGKKVMVIFNKLDAAADRIIPHFKKHLAEEGGLSKEALPEVVPVSWMTEDPGPGSAMEKELGIYLDKLEDISRKPGKVRKNVLKGTCGYAKGLSETIFDALLKENGLVQELAGKLDGLKGKQVREYRTHVKGEIQQRYKEICNRVVGHFKLSGRKGVPKFVGYVLNIPRKIGRLLLGGRAAGKSAGLDIEDIKLRLVKVREEVSTFLRKGSKSGNPLHDLVYRKAVTGNFLGEPFGDLLKRSLPEYFEPVGDWEENLYRSLMEKVEGNAGAKALFIAQEPAQVLFGFAAAVLTGGFSLVDLAIAPATATATEKILELIGGKLFLENKRKELLGLHRECFSRALEDLVLSDVKSAIPGAPDEKTLRDLKERLEKLLDSIS